MPSRPSQNQPDLSAGDGGSLPLIDKARRPLPLTVRGDQGLRDGEVWMVEGRRVDFWSGERLKLGKTYEMRVDLLAQGGNVDLVVKILRVHVGRSTGVESGYLHHAVFRAKSAEDARRFERVFWRLNPEHAPEPGAEVMVSPRKRKRRGDDASSGGGRYHGSAGNPPSVSSMASDGYYAMRSKRRRGRVRSTGSSGATVQHWSTRAQERREPPAVIAPPVDRPQRVVPQVADGDPPTVLARYQAAEALRADLLIEGHDAYLFMAPARDLEPMRKVLLLMQLPQGHFVRVEAKVWESGYRGCVLVARGLSPSLIANLRMALES